MLEHVTIKGTNLPDIWHQTLYKAVEVGRDFKIDRGSFAGQHRKEFDHITIHASCPGVGELLPKLNPALKLDDPVAQDYLDKYMPYLMTGEEQPGEAYTYGQRICKALLDGTFLKPINVHTEEILIKDPEIWEADRGIIIQEESGDSTESSYFLNQMELMIWTYKYKGHRNNQMIMQVGQPTDMMLQDPPCLRHIDTRVQDGKLHFFPYFRSWDLWGGLPANLAAIELMKQYCAAQIGVENGEIIATSKGLHLYNYVWEIAECVRGRTAEEFKAEMVRNTPGDSQYRNVQETPYREK